MVRRLRALVSIPLVALLWTGCGSSAESKPELELRAGLDPELSDEIQQVSMHFDAELGEAYQLPRAAACPKLESYAQLLEDTLTAVALADAKIAGERFAQTHAYLSCVSAREFSLIRDALIESLLSDAVEDGKPTLREIDALALPLVILMHDMGARELSSELAAWLVLRAPDIAARYADPKSGVARAGLFITHGSALRRVTPGERDAVIDSLQTGRFVGSCALAELIAPDAELPLCPRDCDWLPPAPHSDPAAHAELVALCDAYAELRDTGSSAQVAAKMRACLDDYQAAIGKDDVGLCLRVGLESMSKELELRGSTDARVSKRCQLSDGEPMTKEEAAEALARLQRRRAWLNGLVKEIEKLQLQTDNPLAVEALEAARIFLLDEMSQVDAEIDEIEDTGQGTQRCAMDSTSCPGNCDIESAVLELTNSCLEEALDPLAPTDPDPVDPVDPEVDPDSPLGKLSACIVQTVSAAGGTRDTCEAVLTCPDGQVATEVDGVCVCGVDRMDVPPTSDCDWLIDCADGESCTCEGAPMNGDPIPQPPPEFTVVRFRG